MTAVIEIIEAEPEAEPDSEMLEDLSADLEVDFADLGLDALAVEPEDEIDEVVEPMSMQSVAAVDVAPIDIPVVEDLEEEPAIILDLDAADVPAAGAGEATDFVSIMESLDQLAEETAPVDLAQAGFDADLLEDDEVPTAGVISTSDYLEDIAIEDGLGLTSGIGDELSALTGAERHRPGRPTASVNHIPEPGATKIGLDRRVDKDTLLKIIDGIKNL